MNRYHYAHNIKLEKVSQHHNYHNCVLQSKRWLFKGKHQVEYFRLTDFSPPVLSLKFIAFVNLTEANKPEQTVEYSIFIPMTSI